MNANPDIINNTITKNTTYNGASPGYGGGLWIQAPPLPIIKNCIIYGNQATNGVEDLYLMALSNNLNITYCDVGKGLENVTSPDQSSNTNANHLFIDANTNYHLQATSPCIDKGANDGSNKDLEGIMRPLDGDNNGTATSDMGCYEFVHQYADSDNDKQKDADEVIAGTDPTDSNKRFEIDNFQQGDSMELRWNSVLGRKYTVKFSSNIVDCIWIPVFNTNGIDGPITYHYTNETAKGFFRIGVEKLQ